MPINEKKAVETINDQKIDSIQITITNGILKEAQELQRYFKKDKFSDLILQSLSVMKDIKKFQEQEIGKNK